jgi:hypothetical protein
MKRPLHALNYREQIAAHLLVMGYLYSAWDVIHTYRDYIAKAEAWGMTPLRCACNIDKQHRPA